MRRPARVRPKVFATAGLGSGEEGLWVRDLLLLGVHVDARVVIDPAEHERREAAGVPAVTDPPLLDHLLNLPADFPVRDPQVWAEMDSQAPGIVKRGEDDGSVTRLLRSPLEIEDVVVHASPGCELKAVQDASWFASFTRRWIAAACKALPQAVWLEAKVCGVGIISSDQHHVLLPAEDPTSSLIDKWSWLLQEKVYQQWLSQLSQERGPESPGLPTGEASSTGKC